MFTGIIQEIGQLQRIERKGNDTILVVQCSKMQKELELGASISCDGICLTVISFTEHQIKVEAMRETLERTTMKHWYSSRSLNLERAAQADTRLDGHIVQGHVDCTANVIKTSQQGKSLILEIGFPAEYADLLVEKGSIAVDGVSLTVASLAKNSFSVALVGYTIAETTLSSLKPGSRVNLEFDIIGKYINRYLALRSEKLSVKRLRDEGF
jgi:riboflavin synthase